MLITGAGGEIGHGLIERLAEAGDRAIVTLDVAPLDDTIARKVDREIIGSILDHGLLERLLAEYEVDLIFHLAALLSTRSEFTPVAAHQVNVEGTLNLLEFAQHEGGVARPARRLPVSLVDCGVRVAGSRDQERAPAASSEDEYPHPTTMYGCNKLYCEQLGTYYARHYKQLAAEPMSRTGRLPLRAISRTDFRR